MTKTSLNDYTITELKEICDVSELDYSECKKKADYINLIEWQTVTTTPKTKVPSNVEEFKAQAMKKLEDSVYKLRVSNQSHIEIAALKAIVTSILS